MSAIWAGNFFVLKNALAFVDPITFSFLRAFLGGAFVLALGGYKMKGLSRRNVAMLSFIGLFNVSLFQILLNVGLTTVSPGVASTLLYTQPVFVAALSPLVGESLSYRKMGGIVAAFGGVVLIFLSSFSGVAVVIGDVLVLGSSLAWSISVLLYKKWNVSGDGRGVSVQLIAGSVFILPVFAFQEPILEPNPIFWVYLLYNIVLATGAGYIIFWGLLSKTPASELTSYLFLVPALTTVFGSVLAFSIPPWNEVVGTLLVALGIVAANR